MWPDRVSNPGPLTYESGALPIALRGPGSPKLLTSIKCTDFQQKLTTALLESAEGKMKLTRHLCFLTQMSY